MKSTRIALAFVAALAFLTATLNAQNKELTWQETDRMVEAEMGPIITGTQQAQMLEEVGTAISKWTYSTDFNFRFNLVQTDVINAFAFGNGCVYFTTAIMETFDSENELAFVMAHELSHVVLRHAQQSEKFRSRGNQTGIDHMALKEYTRKQEFEADKYGTLFAIRAGYSPLGGVNWFNRMTTLGYEYPPMYVQYSDHPNFTQRVVQSFINIGTYYEYAKHFDYGLLYLSTGDYEESAQSFHKFLEKYPNYKEAYNNIGVALVSHTLEQKNYDTDLWLATAISEVNLFSNNFDEPTRASNSLQTRDFIDAIDNFKLALEFDPYFPQPYLNLALVDALTGDYQSAKERLDKATAFGGESFNAYTTLGFLYSQQGKYADASSAFEKAAALEPTNPQGYYNLAYARQWNGEDQLAISSWEKFLSMMPEGDLADNAKRNLAGLRSGGAPADENLAYEEASHNASAKGGDAILSGLKVGASKDETLKIFKAPASQTEETDGEVWEYYSPTALVKFDANDRVTYALALEDPTAYLDTPSGLRVTTGMRAPDLVGQLGKPPQILQEGVYVVYNYTSDGVAFWIQDSKVVGLFIYELEN